MSTIKDQFRNDSGGVIGVIVLDGTGGTTGIAVQPGDTVWLTEDEQAFTANAPKRPEDNPFVSGALTLVTEAKDMKHARPLRPVTIEEPVILGEETGAGPVAQGEPPEGTRPAGEEVGTPDAVPTEPETEVAGDGRTIVKRKKPATT